MHVVASGMSSTRITQRINAPRAIVYRALLDPCAIATWKVPSGMTSRVHELEAREGGRFRVSLTYAAADRAGKTSEHTDTYHGYFAQLVPNERVVEVTEFETTDANLRGEMTITTTLRDVDGGTEITGLHDGLPAGVAPADNETGWRESFARLASLVESGWQPTAAAHDSAVDARER
jgi:uncharacterized protein YndB with AHSA1/START domain